MKRVAASTFCRHLCCNAVWGVNKLRVYAYGFPAPLLFLCLTFCANAQPCLVNKNTRATLLVNQKSFLIPGGETGNSSASGLAYLRPTGKDDFIIAGTGVVITFTSADVYKVCNIATADGAQYENGKEIKGRKMHGGQEQHIPIPGGQWGIQKVSMEQSPSLINNYIALPATIHHRILKA